VFIRVHQWFCCCATASRFAATFVFSLCAFLFAARAHPIHTSLAEADYNRTSRKLEIALRVFADDLEAALGERTHTRISFLKTPPAEFVPALRAYLGERFVVRAADGRTVPLEWIGHSLKDAANEIWLFFELTLPAGLDDATVHHAVLSERFSDQLNTVQLRDAGRRTTLVFLSSHGPKRIRFRPE
jgi:hypothetical protein